MNKKVYHITEKQASVLITEQLSDPNLLKMVGEKTNHSAYPNPISTGKFDDETENVGVGVKSKEKEPEVDPRTLPVPSEFKEALLHLKKATECMLNGAPKFNEKSQKSRAMKFYSDLGKLIGEANADLNINEIDLTN